MKKILFSDMDGTIIDLTKMKHIHDREMLEELKKQNHLIAFNTGRNLQEALFCVEKYQFPYDYLILNNGAHIVNKVGEELFKKIIPQYIGRSIIEYAMKIPDLYVFFYNGNRTLGYCNKKTFEHTLAGNIEINDVCFQEEYIKVKEFDIIAVYQVNEEIDHILRVQKYIQDHFRNEAIGTLNMHYLDITAQGCSKGTGVEMLKKIINEDLATYCVGDSYNDIPMFHSTDLAYTFHHVNQDISKHAHKQVNYVYEVIEDMLAEDIL